MIFYHYFQYFKRLPGQNQMFSVFPLVMHSEGQNRGPFKNDG